MSEGRGGDERSMWKQGRGKERREGMKERKENKEKGWEGKFREGEGRRRQAVVRSDVIG